MISYCSCAAPYMAPPSLLYLLLLMVANIIVEMIALGMHNVLPGLSAPMELPHASSTCVFVNRHSPACHEPRSWVIGQRRFRVWQHGLLAPHSVLIVGSLTHGNVTQRVLHAKPT